MGKYSNTVLDRDRAFDISMMDELLEEGKTVLKAAIDISRKIGDSVSRIDDAYAEIPAGYKEGALGNAISDMRTKLLESSYEETMDRMEGILNKLMEEVPAYDSKLAESMDGMEEVLNSLRRRIEDLREFLDTADVNISCAEFNGQLEDLAENWNRSTEDLRTALTEIENDMLGVSAAATPYSKDPVNLSTGNFVYDHEDMKIGGEIPLSFHRYYNSKDRSKGSLGRCFLHNYDSRLEENAEKGKASISMKDGQKKTFQKLEDGTYRSLYSATETLTKEKEGTWALADLSGERTLYNVSGQMTRQENRYGRGIAFSYDEAGRLEKAETDNGAYLAYSYDEEGMLACVTDHTGRKVELSYAKGKLSTVKVPSGSVYTYRYAKNGRLEETVNPRGFISVKNTYDEKRRVIRQEFPDGGHMEYAYDDKKRQVILTERNGSKTTYIHDSKYRNTDILYEDGTKEHFGYNGKNQRVLHTDRNGNTTRMAYDNRGNLTQVVNPLGEKMSLTYDADNRLILLKVNGKEKLHNIYDRKGNLVSSTGADGTGNRMEYDGQGRPVCIENADKSVTKITYDPKGNIISIRDAGGTEISYRYDSLNRVIQSVDRNGNATAYEYNDADKVSRVTNPLGAYRSYSYNESGKITEVTDYDGYTVKADYNETGRVSRITDKEGNIKEYTYDRMWNTSLIRQPDGGTVLYKYDRNNRLCEECLPEGGSILYTYDGNGNRTGITDAEGNHTVFTYDALNRIIKTTDAAGAEMCYDYDAEGNLACVTDALGNKTVYAYDGMGRCISETDALGNTTAYTYDMMGNLTGIRYPNGGMEERVYQNGKLAEHRRADGSIMRYAYDANGNCICMENGTGEKLAITYDALDRRESVTNPDGGIVRYEYDAVGNITKMTDGNGNVTRYVYTPNGNLSLVTDALGNETRYAYDSMGHLVKVERTGEASEIQTTAYQWDTRGLVTSIKNPMGAEEFFGYDRNGRLTDKWDRDGYHTAYSYDGRGLVKDILYGDGNSVSYSYDALGKLEEARNADGVIRIVNDALGRVTSVVGPDGKAVGYEWGSMGERLRLIYPDGKEAAYSYNEKGQLASLSAGNGTITYAYDPLGLLKEKVLPNGTVTEYTYTGAGQLERIRHTGKGIEEEYSYGYDRAGNKIRAEKKRQGAEADSGRFTYEYDALNRLTGVNRNGRLLRRYAYDAFGNRTLKEDYGGGEPAQTMYRYNAGNQLVSLTDGEGEQTYTYDRRGNLTAVSRGEELLKAFTFDAANRMSGALRIKGGIEKRAKYRYDAFGNRIGQTVYRGVAGDGISDMGKQAPQDPEKQIRYTIDLTRQYHNMLAAEDSAGQSAQTFYWDGNVAAMEEAGQDSYYLQDDLGSPMMLLDGGGEVRESYGFDEFGQSLFQHQEGQAQPFGYTGYQMEDVGGLYFAQARRYDAGTGRFVSEDIVKGFIVLPFSLNHYIYCWNRPLGLVDLNGLWPSWSDIKSTVSTAGDSIASGFNKAAASVESFYEDHKKAIDTTLKIAGAVVVTGLLVAGTVCTGGALGAICAGALAGGVIGIGVDAVMQIRRQIITDGTEKFNLDQMLISGLSGASSGALSYITANPYILFGGNAMINIGAYCATQGVRDEEITAAGVIVSGIIGGVAGVVSGSPRNVTDLSQTALGHAQIGIAPIMGKEEMYSYMIEEVIRNMGRSTISEIGRYIAAGKIISLFEEVCGE